MNRTLSRLEEPKAYLIINKKLASQRSLNFSKTNMQRIGYLGVLLAGIAFLMIPPIDVSAANDIDTKLQELQELQNQLKALLEEQESDDTSLLPPSNVMKLKVKEDKGIRGIAYLKIDLGIREKARDNGVASVVYTPNFDPVAHSRGLPQQLITINDPDNYLNHENLELTWQAVECIEGSPSRNNYCMEFTFGHEFLQAPEYDIIGLTVVDWNRNVSYSYFNDGIDVVGESLLPPKTQIIVEQGKPPKHIEITQKDKINDLWEDENENIWTRNNAGTWIKITHEELHEIKDKFEKVMTRDSNNFEKLSENEILKAIELFDSVYIQSDLPDSVERIFYGKLLRSDNNILQNEIKNEADRASEFLSNLYPGLRQNFD